MTKLPVGCRLHYLICKECRNPDVGAYCDKCGECGRKFEDGILTNGDDYPGYDPDEEE